MSPSERCGLEPHQHCAATAGPWPAGRSRHRIIPTCARHPSSTLGQWSPRVVCPQVRRAAPVAGATRASSKPIAQTGVVSRCLLQSCLVEARQAARNTHRIIVTAQDPQSRRYPTIDKPWRIKREAHVRAKRGAPSVISTMISSICASAIAMARLLRSTIAKAS